MNAVGSSFASLGLHSIPIPFSPPSFTLLTRYVPASTGVHGRRLTSQRGGTPTHCGGGVESGALSSARADVRPTRAERRSPLRSRFDQSARRRLDPVPRRARERP